MDSTRSASPTLTLNFGLFQTWTFSINNVWSERRNITDSGSVPLFYMRQPVVWLPWLQFQVFWALLSAGALHQGLTATASLCVFVCRCRVCVYRVYWCCLWAALRKSFIHLPRHLFSAFNLYLPFSSLLLSSLLVSHLPPSLITLSPPLPSTERHSKCSRSDSDVGLFLAQQLTSAAEICAPMLNDWRQQEAQRDEEDKDDLRKDGVSLRGKQNLKVFSLFGRIMIWLLQ